MYTDTDMDATKVNVYSFIFKMLYSGSQQSYEQTIIKRKRSTFLTSCVEQWLRAVANSVQRCVCGCRVRARSGGIVQIHRNRFYPEFQGVKAWLWLHLSATLHKTLTARHSSQATYLRVGVGLYWLAGSAWYCCLSPSTDDFHRRCLPCWLCRFE